MMPKIFDNPEYASNIFRALSNKNRLIILSGLLDGEMKVGEMESLLGISQPTLSQQLARLRSAQLVKTRRVSKEIFYSLANVDAKLMLEWLSANFEDKETLEKTDMRSKLSNQSIAPLK